MTTTLSGCGCPRCATPVRLPRRLAVGDTIAVCTPSGPGAAIAPARFARGVRWLRDAGYDVRIGAQATADGYAAGSARARADELNAALHDGSVRAIIASIGGYNTNGVLPLIDYSALADDPKILLGYSDITALLLAAYTRARVVTFHGPTLMPELAEFPAPLAYTWEGLCRAVMSSAPLGELGAASEVTEEFLRWDSEDHRARRLSRGVGWSWLTGGVGSGRLLGGNLDTLCALVGTPYLPCTRGAVLFWETCLDSLAMVDRSLCQLDAAGVTAELAGMVVGRSFRAGVGFEADLRALTLEHYGGRGFPILAGVDLGHGDPMLTLPIGVELGLDDATGTCRVLGAAVAGNRSDSRDGGERI